jgi:hypothetical protein
MGNALYDVHEGIYLSAIALRRDLSEIRHSISAASMHYWTQNVILSAIMLPLILDAPLPVWEWRARSAIVSSL